MQIIIAILISVIISTAINLFLIKGLAELVAAEYEKIIDEYEKTIKNLFKE